MDDDVTLHELLDEIGVPRESGGFPLGENGRVRLMNSLHTTEVNQMRHRLRLAERLCLVFGWTGIDDSPRGKAATQLWTEWAHHVGDDFTGPEAHPELNDGSLEALAAERDRMREETLRRFLAPDEHRPTRSLQVCESCQDKLDAGMPAERLPHTNCWEASITESA